MNRFKITIEALEIEMYLGIHQAEREAMQKVLIDVEIDIDVGLVEGIPPFDYDRVVDHIRGFSGARIATQEELIVNLHQFITGFSAVHHARVWSRKPDIYPDCQAVGVVYEG